MKRFLVLLASVFVAGSAYADAANQQKLMGVGFSAEQAAIFDALYVGFANANTNVVPTASATYDLGTSSKKWRVLYLSSTADVSGLIIRNATGTPMAGVTPASGNLTTSGSIAASSNLDAVGIILRNATGTPLAGVTPASGNFVTGGVINAGSFGSTGDLSFSVAGKGPVLLNYVPTMAATPADGTNMLTGRYNSIPTAAANTAALFETTPTSGVVKVTCNRGVNAVRLKAGGASTLNGSTAGAYIPLAVQQCAYCVNDDGTNWSCGLLTVPTPAGP
jgi:hypothetical protein